VAVLTLAVGIGVNAAVFALVDGLLLRPVVPLHPAEVVSLFSRAADGGREYRRFSPQEVQALPIALALGAGLRWPWPAPPGPARRCWPASSRPAAPPG
jgi:hypothetical protein